MIMIPTDRPVRSVERKRLTICLRIPPLSTHTGRRGRLGVLKPETGDGTPGLPEKPAPVQPAYRRGNSLPCRAVVASTGDAGPLAGRRVVLIPFIAGQWSLRSAPSGLGTNSRVSIPFIAGQWSLRSDLAEARVDAVKVSIPFIAGQWSLPGDGGDGHGRRADVSIPFIAGQWSLHIYTFA